jgi:hypothetical protein
MKLTATMQEAVDFASAHGGVLIRLPGGFWVRDGHTQWDGWQAQKTFGTPTVQALVSRGVAEYTQWADGRNGRFPVRMALNARKEAA